jgi:hypothetical protein
MEGGVEVMTKRKVIVLVLLVLMVIFPLIGYAKSKGVVTKTCRMQGKLQAIDLKERWAMIGGLQWVLAKDFNSDFLSSHLERIEYKQGIRVIFYVRYTQEAGPHEKTVRGDKMERVNRLDVMKRINEKGGTIYKMERSPM